MKIVNLFLSNKALINIKDEQTYLSLIIILVPLMNFLSGIVIDLYAPSMPAIALSLHTSTMAVKNTMTATMIGFAVGCILFGVLFDTWGRRKIITVSLIIFIISSLLAAFCHSIYQLMIIRFIQGLMTSAMSIGCRTLVADHFTGHQFVVAVLYASLAYGLGPVVGPFIGGYLQYQFGWQANFYTFAIFGAVIFLVFLLFVNERFKKVNDFTLMKAISFYKTLFSHKAFLYCAFIFGFIQLLLMIYPTLGPFLVQHELNYSAITYGNTALIVGLGYLFGTLSNRFLLKSFSQIQLINAGYLLLVIAVLVQLLFSIFIGLSLWTIVLPITLMGYALGFIYGNILSNCLRLFPQNVGTCLATLFFFLMFFAAIGVLIISYFRISSLYHLFYVYFVAIVIQLLVYAFLLRKNMVFKV